MASGGQKRASAPNKELGKIRSAELNPMLRNYGCSMEIIRLFIHENLDGVLVIPEKNNVPDSRRRIFIGGGPVSSLNLLQVQAMVDLALREPGAYKRFQKIHFLCAKAWAESETGPERFKKIAERNLRDEK